MSDNDEVIKLFSHFMRKEGSRYDEKSLYPSIMMLLDLSEEDRNMLLDFVRDMSKEQQRYLHLYRALFLEKLDSAIPKDLLKNIMSTQYLFFKDLYKQILSSEDVIFYTDSGTELKILMSETKIINSSFVFYVGFPEENMPFFKYSSKFSRNDQYYGARPYNPDLTESDVSSIKEKLIQDIISDMRYFDKGKGIAFIWDTDNVHDLQISQKLLKYVSLEKRNIKKDRDLIVNTEKAWERAILANLLYRRSIGNKLSTEVLFFIRDMLSVSIIKTQKHIFTLTITTVAIDIKTGEILSFKEGTEAHSEYALLRELMK